MLRIEKITKRFGGLTAVNRVDCVIDGDGITGLVGPNGSGKSTLFHLITGFYRADEGRIYFNDKLISSLTPHRISRMGLVRSFQQTRVLAFMSSLDNLLSATPGQTGERLSSVFFRPGKVRREENANRKKAEEILELLQLAHQRSQLAGRLSFGQQKLLELGRVLMAEPSMILLDEPTAGVNPTLIRQLVDVLRDLGRRGIKVFLIEHNMPLVTEICRNVLVMDSGSLIFSGTPAEAVEDPGVIEAYLGRANCAA